MCGRCLLFTSFCSYSADRNPDCVSTPAGASVTSSKVVVVIDDDDSIKTVKASGASSAEQQASGPKGELRCSTFTLTQWSWYDVGVLFVCLWRLAQFCVLFSCLVRLVSELRHFCYILVFSVISIPQSKIMVYYHCIFTGAPTASAEVVIVDDDMLVDTPAATNGVKTAEATSTESGENVNLFPTLWLHFFALSCCSGCVWFRLTLYRAFSRCPAFFEYNFSRINPHACTDFDGMLLMLFCRHSGNFQRPSRVPTWSKTRNQGRHQLHHVQPQPWRPLHGCWQQSGQHPRQCHWSHRHFRKQ